MSDSNQPTQIDFFYMKSQGYRNYHADGAAGGRTPSGELFLNFYVERGAIPQRERYELKADGQLGGLIESEGKNGIVRDIECGVVLSIRAAKDLRDWLTKMTEGREI